MSIEFARKLIYYDAHSLRSPVRAALESFYTFREFDIMRERALRSILISGNLIRIASVTGNRVCIT